MKNLESRDQRKYLLKLFRDSSRPYQKMFFGALFLQIVSVILTDIVSPLVVSKILVDLANEYAKINGGLTSVQNLQNERSLTVYPNPTTGKLKIMTDVKGEYDITIYNSLGKMAYYKKDVFGEIEIDLVGNFKWLYFYQIGLQDVFLRTGKIVLE